MGRQRHTARTHTHAYAHTHIHTYTPTHTHVHHHTNFSHVFSSSSNSSLCIALDGFRTPYLLQRRHHYTHCRGPPVCVCDVCGCVCVCFVCVCWVCVCVRVVFVRYALCAYVCVRAHAPQTSHTIIRFQHLDTFIQVTSSSRNMIHVT